jgi:uncharacterized delta-60 repeat protein
MYRLLHPRPVVFVVLLALALAVPAMAAGAGSVDLDPAFGTNGRVLTALPRGRRMVKAARSADGDLLVARSTHVARYSPDGRLDVSFGHAGVATIPLPDGAVFLLADLAVDPQGRIIVGGTLISESPPTYAPAGAGTLERREWAVLARLLPDGSADPGFGTGGFLVTDLGLPAPLLQVPGADPLPPLLNVSGFTLDATGRIILIGTFYAVTKFCRGLSYRREEAFLARLLPDGTLDQGFAAGGIRVDPGLSAVASPQLDRHGRILYAGARNTGCDALRPGGVGRLDPSGNLDGGFGVDGWQSLARQDGVPRDLALDHQGRVLVLGSEPGTPVEREPRGDFSLAALFRLGPNGTVDRSFARFGRALARIPGRHSHFNSLAVDGRGGVVLAGVRIRRVVQPFLNSSFLASRYTPRGRLDRSFGSAGLLETRFGSRSTADANQILFSGPKRFLLVGPLALGVLPTGQGVALARYRLR